MPTYKHIIFDLDGTLTNSRTGIVNAALYALKKMGITHPPVVELNNLIGIPLQEYLQITGNLKVTEIEMAVKEYRKYYGKKGAFENEAYPGIPELLNALVKNGKNIYISTAKYEKYARVVVDYFSLLPFIKDLVGADAEGIYATKSELAAKIISRNEINDLLHTVVVGDKHMDIKAGHDNGIDSIGVTYGFGSLDELEKEKPTYIAESVNELKDILV